MVFSSYMQGGLGRGGKSVALSAYVLVSLLQAGFDPQVSVYISYCVYVVEKLTRQSSGRWVVQLYNDNTF